MVGATGARRMRRRPVARASTSSTTTTSTASAVPLENNVSFQSNLNLPWLFSMCLNLRIYSQFFEYHTSDNTWCIHICLTIVYSYLNFPHLLFSSV
ncbi:hypothetical protein SLEP1_g16071 [Rubroshorea leprosula]|uniref:Uncharacterized protein n=1 Tax=Rubroshorea leprosula TaxID=152421 RepID=A0AAV5IX98_9ROSI|nr:hypothetical protein SLEP1_g16071 [Rubroshorea leprosula]